MTTLQILDNNFYYDEIISCVELIVNKGTSFLVRKNQMLFDIWVYENGNVEVKYSQQL